MADEEPLIAERAQADLERIQEESERQALPEQERVFRVAKRIRSKLHNLPDPTNPPLGFAPGKGYDAVFPFIRLPHLAPNLNGDWVQFGSPELEPNRLYYGDNLQVLRTLPSNSIDLIYIDPPFFSGAEYNVIWGDTNEVRTFSDIWEGGLPTYLVWLNARLWEMRRVLKPTGSIYVHCDWHASHYIKAELDRILGYESFRNEIVWRRAFAHNDPSRYGNIHDVVLYYAKSNGRTWNKLHHKPSPDYVDQFFDQYDPVRQERYNRLPLDAPRHGDGGNLLYEWKGVWPAPGRTWAYLIEQMEEFDRQGRIHYPRLEGGKPRLKRYESEYEGTPLQDIWTDISKIHNQSDELLGYPTQKPEDLIERIINASSNGGDVVADFFCGGGTTASVAQRLGRRWIACDSSRVAVSVTLNRLVELGEEITGVRSNYGVPGQVQTALELPTGARLPDVRVYYVGVYPMDRFGAVDQATFEDFILKCLAAQRDNSDRAITGWRSAREPLRVGPSNPDAAPSAQDLQAFFEACLRHLEPNVRLLTRYVCWRTSPELVAYRKRLVDYIHRNVQPRGADLDLDFLLIDGEEFRSRVRQKYPDADDSDFLLRFTKEPVVGEIVGQRIRPLHYVFEAPDASSANIGGFLVNCQWDFDYHRGHFAADRNYVLSRRELKGKDAKLAGHKYEAVLAADHAFEKPGSCVVACRVQDNFGAEAVRTLKIEVC